MSINLTIRTVNGKTFTVPFERHQNFETFITNVTNYAIERGLMTNDMIVILTVSNDKQLPIRITSENFDEIKNNFQENSVIRLLATKQMNGGGKKRKSKKPSKKSMKGGAKRKSKKTSKKSSKKSMKGGAKRKSKKTSKKTSRR